MNEPQLLHLALAWLGYFLLHSLLASLGIKGQVAKRWPGLMPAYRLAFNLLAVVLLLPLLYLIYRFPGDTVWAWQGGLFWLANGLALMALAGFGLSSGCYDTSEFLGFRQWRERETEVMDQEAFQISSFHRHVRHPWYSLALVLIWTRDMSEAFLLSAILMSLYFIIGSRMEERKLIQYHGQVYREYMQAVPGLVPRPWRRLSQEQADALLARASILPKRNM